MKLRLIQEFNLDGGLPEKRRDEYISVSFLNLNTSGQESKVEICA